jgi:hypothetical protein
VGSSPEGGEQAGLGRLHTLLVDDQFANSPCHFGALCILKVQSAPFPLRVP